MKQNYLTEKSQQLVKWLIENISKKELIDFICKANSSYTTATAESFLDYTKQRQASQQTFYKTEFDEFVLAVVGYWFLESAYDFEKIATQKLEYYKQTRESQAKEDAKKYRLEQGNENFRALMVDFYLWRKTEEDVKLAIFGKTTPDARQYKRHNERKTFVKIQNKMKTKTHDLSKILKLIDEDIERDYAKYFTLTDEQKKRAEKIENSHWFVNRW